MNIQLCVAWFVFGFFVGQLIIIAIAVITDDMRRNKNGKTKEGICKQSSNDNNQGK